MAPCIANNGTLMNDSIVVLRGLILHTGNSRSSGHYVAMARRRASAEPDFRNNDGKIVGIPRLQLSSPMKISDADRDFDIIASLSERRPIAGFFCGSLS